MAFNGLRLRRVLALTFGLMAAILAGSLTLLIGADASNIQQKDVRSRLDSLAEVTIHVLDNGMYERMHDIVGLAQVEQLRNPEHRDADRQLLEGFRSGMSDYAWLGVADPSGHVLYGTRRMLEGDDVGRQPWFTEGRSRLYLGDVHTAPYLASLLGRHPAGEEWRFVDIAVPLQDSRGRALGVLGAQLSWEWARGVEDSVLTLARRKAGMEIFIVNAAGQVILAPRGLEDVRLPPLEALRSVPEALTWPDGRDYLSGMRTSTGMHDYPGLGWRVVARQPVEKAFAVVHRLQVYIAGIGVMLAALFGLLGTILAHFLSRPLAQLAHRADRIRQGHPARQLPDGGVFHETRQLSTSLGQLLGDLQANQAALAELNASLEQQVRDRTEALETANQHLMTVLEERIRLQLQLEELASTDSLTGLLNRRAFHERADVECRRALRHPKSALSVVAFDIDHFKRVNDTYGHDTGDEVLRQCAEVCRRQLRDIDIIARFGGEEFIVLLPGSDAGNALQVAERLRHALADMRVATEKGELRITVSLGVVAHDPAEDIAATLRHADEALYAAKGGGRNRTVTYGDN